jgi:hypothetical protein
MKHKGQTHNAGLGTSLAVMQQNESNYITPTIDPSRYATQLKERDSEHFSNVFKNAIRARRQQDKSVAATPTTSGGP